MLLKLVAEGLGQPAIKTIDPATGNTVMKKGFWVMVLVDVAHSFHSFHVVADQTPNDRAWGVLTIKGHLREIWVLADNVWDAISQAREKGILSV
jgi:hypothetical protein